MADENSKNPVHVTKDFVNLCRCAKVLGPKHGMSDEVAAGSISESYEGMPFADLIGQSASDVLVNLCAMMMPPPIVHCVADSDAWQLAGVKINFPSAYTWEEGESTLKIGVNINNFVTEVIVTCQAECPVVPDATSHERHCLKMINIVVLCAKSASDKKGGNITQEKPLGNQRR